MFRRTLLAAVLGTAALTGTALTPAAAEAHPPVAFHQRFEVVYRHGHHGWAVHGTYLSRFEAERAAESLRCHGYIVEIRGC